jgi:hypothetical protein
MLGQAVRVGADQHAAGHGRRLHAGGHVGRVAHGGVFGADAVADLVEHRQAGVDADAHVEVDAVLPLDPRGIVSGLGLDLQPGAHRALGIVLVRDRRAKDGQHGVAHQPRHGAAIAVDGPVHKRKGAVHHLGDQLWVEPLTHGGGAHHVREQHGHLLALAFGLARRGRGFQGLAAVRTELGEIRVNGLAARADHGQILLFRHDKCR